MTEGTSDMESRIYRMVVSVLDLECMSSLEDVIEEVERSRHFAVSVRKAEMISANWADDHPLNRKMTYAEYEAWWETATREATGQAHTPANPA